MQLRLHRSVQAMKAELRARYQAEQSAAFERYLANAKKRMVPVASEGGAELYHYRAPVTEKPFTLKRLESGHWLIRSGYATDEDPDAWHRVKASEPARCSRLLGRRPSVGGGRSEPEAIIDAARLVKLPAERRRNPEVQAEVREVLRDLHEIGSAIAQEAARRLSRRYL